MSNFHEMTPQWLSEKISNFSNMNILYTALKYVIWRFRTCNYFREMFKFRDFMNTKKFREICFACIFAKFRYLAILTESADHVL